MSEKNKIALILFPVFGIWSFLFFDRSKQLCQAFVLHGLVIIYFAVSMVFLKLSLWVTPYFLEQVIDQVISFNILVCLFGFLFPYYLFFNHLNDNFFDRFIFFNDLKNYLFK